MSSRSDENTSCISISWFRRTSSSNLSLHFSLCIERKGVVLKWSGGKNDKNMSCISIPWFSLMLISNFKLFFHFKRFFSRRTTLAVCIPFIEAHHRRRIVDYVIVSVSLFGFPFVVYELKEVLANYVYMFRLADLWPYWKIWLMYQYMCFVSVGT